MRICETIPIPSRLASRPRDARGYPIPWMAAVDANGVADFRVQDRTKWLAAEKLRCCTMCGESMGRHLAFIGGPVSHRTRLFTDLPMHKDCATYAVQVCPFLAAPRMRYAEGVQMDGVVTQVGVPGMVLDRPERFFVATTRDYELVNVPGNGVLAQARPWESSEWWRHGVKLTAEEVSQMDGTLK